MADTAKKSPTKKAAPKKAGKRAAKDAAKGAKKAAASKATKKKPAAKKFAAKKAAAKKVSVKKAAAKKVAAKAVAPRKAAAKKVAAEKSALKKAGATERRADKGAGGVPDFAEFPAGSVTRYSTLVCLACIFDLFTKQLGLAPRTAYSEIRRYAPTVEELTTAARQRPFFESVDWNPRCPYCDAARRWHARLDTYRVEGGKA
ncbi:MAG TPA: hypothetical protein VEQ42_08410, partial [Pyrinomonadaceae bacterium]|nr:hypothetical protein [Pyrinomonadaceae bacterium]